MLKTKPRRATSSSVRKPIVHPKVKSLARLYRRGTDIEAFYAAQREMAADSREYAASRRKR
jgi:hypothetical protein